MNPQQQASLLVGKTVLFLVENDWNIGQLVNAARNARAAGIDTLCVRRAEGTVKYYGTPAQLEAEYHAVAETGCGYIPMHYGYGPKYGLSFVDAEAQVLLEMTDAIGRARGGPGFVCEDLEIEYDGRPDAAQRLAANMNGKPGFLYVTTWADPNQQSWDQVARELLPVTNMWIPQAYSNWLDSQLWQDKSLGEPNVCPALDLSQEFGANNTYANALNAKNSGASTVWLWEYGMLGAQRNLVQNIVRLMK